jgi:type IV secretory pathway VirB10-like protein
MFSRPLAFLLLALACITAAAGGAYVATRRTASDVPAAATATPATPATSAKAAAAQPVTETEATVSAPKPEAAPEPAAKAEPAAPAAHRAEAPARRSSTARAERSAPSAGHPLPTTAGAPAAQPEPQPAPVAAPPAPEPAKPLDPPAPPKPQFEDVILPVAAVIGLQLDTPLSSDRAHVEDRVDAHVTRDVMASGHVAIPSGSKVVGSVIAVEQGGKVSQPAHLAIRFHTLILADGSQVALRTESIDRRSESPANSSTKKIGGAAVAGTILGAIIGGGKGAAAGAGIGAGAGTAAVMAGDRAAVTMPAGQLLNARLSSPATITVEKREQQ